MMYMHFNKIAFLPIMWHVLDQEPEVPRSRAASMALSELWQSSCYVNEPRAAVNANKAAQSFPQSSPCIPDMNCVVAVSIEGFKTRYSEITELSLYHREASEFPEKWKLKTAAKVADPEIWG
jgi:hypothetical protein